MAFNFFYIFYVACIVENWRSEKMSGGKLIFKPPLEKVKQKVKLTYNSIKLLKMYFTQSVKKLTQQ